MFKNTGLLIVYALVDEKNGLEGAIGILEPWYTDPDCFSEKWITAVNRTIDKVRNILG